MFLYIFISRASSAKDEIQNIRPAINVRIIYIYCITKQSAIPFPSSTQKLLSYVVANAKAGSSSEE